MKNSMFIIALLSMMTFFNSTESNAQNWNTVDINKKLRKPNPYLKKVPRQALAPQRQISRLPQQQRVQRQQRIVQPQVRRVPQQRTIQRVPQRQIIRPSHHAPYSYVPRSNFSNQTNQVLSESYQLLADSKKLMRDVQPAVDRRNRRYQNASPQQRMQMDAQKRAVLNRANANIKANYGSDWVRSFNPSGGRIYVIER